MSTPSIEEQIISRFLEAIKKKFPPVSEGMEAQLRAKLVTEEIDVYSFIEDLGNDCEPKD